MLLGGVLAFVLLRRDQGPGGGPAAREPVPVLAALPDFVLTDQAGQEFGSDRLAGHIWVGTFIFTRCQATCPAQTATMAQLQGRLRGSQYHDLVHLVSISVDPDHDTPTVLSEYAARHEADPRIWHFLTGPADDVRDLSEAGFRLAAGGAAADAPAHSSKLALVDRWGRVRGYYEGQSPESLEGLWRDLEQVADEITPPAVYTFEAAARRDPAQVFVKSMTGDDWLRARQREQAEDAKQWKAFHEFRFTDRRYASGISFRNRVVDDAGRLYKAAHYDHGNGLAVADVDGDGREDIYFVNQVGPSQLWRNLGGGRFEDITATAGVALPEPIKVTATFADVNNDGSPDLYVTTVRGGNHLFLNDGKGRFTDATAASGLGLSGHYSGAVFFDYDRDGLLDLFLCDVGKYTADNQLPVRQPPAIPGDPAPGGDYRYFEAFPDAFYGHLKPERERKSRLFRNTGNATFADVTEQVGLGPTGWCGDATPFDVNGDGWPDLYVLNMQGNDEYFENQGGRAFVRKSRAVFPKTPWGSMGAKVFDWNNDGVLDLLVTDMHSDMSDNLGTDRASEKRKSEITWPETYLRTGGASIFGNALYQGDGKGAFRDVSDPAGTETYWPWGLSVGDLNADGFQDVFVTAGMGYPFRYGVNSLLLNDGGRRFVDAEFALGMEPRRGRRTAKPWFELDATGADANHPAAAGRTGRVTFWGALSSRSSAIFDLDDDGDLDVVTNDFNSEPMVLISDLGKRKQIHYLKVRLVGGATASTKAAAAAGPVGPAAQSNRDGLGATVRVRYGGRSYLQVHDGKSGYLSQSSLPLYFGLGDAAAADEIEVRWPSGRKQTIAGPIQANRLVTIQEPTAPPAP
jgi:cytochrome oxidase Cu insertion factor (SCO1/SenC/PrrC family)